MVGEIVRKSVDKGYVNLDWCKRGEDHVDALISNAVWLVKPSWVCRLASVSGLIGHKVPVGIDE